MCCIKENAYERQYNFVLNEMWIDGSFIFAFIKL